MQEIEIEKVYLAKNLPDDLDTYTPTHISISDFYDSNSVDALKLRQKGNHYEMIKKEVLSTYKRKEHIISIKKEEFDVLIKATVQSHRKKRYLYPLKDGHTCEIDVYEDRLDGYVRVEVEFCNEKDLHNFVPPTWFDQEITPLNHTIHKDLGRITFDKIRERFHKEGIDLAKVVI